MYYGLIGVAFVAFSGATEFIPELNEKLRIVPLSLEFKCQMVGVMVLDYVGCWAVEQGFKAVFSDFRPKDIAVRRGDQVRFEEERRRREAEEREKERIKREEEGE